MRTWMRWSGLVLGSGVLGAVLVMEACQVAPARYPMARTPPRSDTGQDQLARTNQGLGSLPAPSTPPEVVNYPTDWPAIAIRRGDGSGYAGSNGIAAGEPNYRDAPEIDLSRALRAAQGGGTTAASISSLQGLEATKLPMWGDIPT